MSVNCLLVETKSKEIQVNAESLSFTLSTEFGQGFGYSGMGVDVICDTAVKNLRTYISLCKSTITYFKNLIEWQ